MKRIIELPDKVVKAIQNGEDYRYDIHTAIAQSIPYNPTGDLISRSALKETLKENEWITDDPFAESGGLEEIIDNAQAVEHSLLPLSGEADNAYMRGYEVGKAEGILKASTRSHGEWKHLGGDEWVCSECGHVYYNVKTAGQI